MLIGIDLGTSSLKALLLGEDGTVLATTARTYDINVPQPGWAEQSPEGWYTATCAAVRELLAHTGTPGKQVQAIGLSGQMHGTVCLSRDGQALRPAIIWADQRSQAQVAHLQARLDPARLGRMTGTPLATGFMLPTWLWLQEREPEVLEETRCLLLPKDYLRYRLTGEIGSEPSDASSTALLEPGSRTWNLELMAELGLEAELLPPLSASTQVAGGLLARVAAETGLHPGTPVVFGGSDQACQALGHGIVTPGSVLVTIGTGGQLFAPLNRPLYDPQVRLHLFCHALPGVWHLLSAMLAAGLSFKWLRDRVLRGESYQSLADSAARVPPGAEGLFFLPHLVGERTPYMDPQATGGFIGLRLHHGPEHLARAVMEGVVFTLRQGLDLMVALGTEVDQLVASGGGTNHPLWLQLQADIFDRPIQRATTTEAAALGAALLAGMGAGQFPDYATACQLAVPVAEQTIYPDHQRAALYQEAYTTFARLYPALKEIHPNQTIR